MITHHRLDRSPGQRFRFEQYLPYLEQNGFEFQLSNIVKEEEDSILYGKGKFFQKVILAAKAWLRRYKDVRRAEQFDIIFIFREAFFTGSSRFERLFAKSRAKVIFDFDDAIWLPNVSIHNRKLKKLKNPNKTNKLLSYADMIFAGNQYLADYASNFNSVIKVIPTTIDTSYHLPRTVEKGPEEPIVIGWTGSHTTLRYLDLVKAALQKLKEKYRQEIEIKIICDLPWEQEGLGVVNVEWKRDDEIQQLQSIDIGIMPLTDDEWSRGKCAFKALQYMGIGIPAILSPVGVNKEIINEGVNGYLAESEEEWYEKLDQIIQNASLRKQIGTTARQYIISNYSVEAHRSRYLEYFNEVLGE